MLSTHISQERRNSWTHFSQERKKLLYTHFERMQESLCTHHKNGQLLHGSSRTQWAVEIRRWAEGRLRIRRWLWLTGDVTIDCWPSMIKKMPCSAELPKQTKAVVRGRVGLARILHNMRNRCYRVVTSRELGVLSNFLWLNQCFLKQRKTKR